MNEKKHAFWCVLFCLTLVIIGCGGLRQANHKLDRGEYEDAVRLFKEFLDKNPKSIEAGNGLGYAYLKTGRLDLAETEFKKVLSIESSNPDALLNLGRTYLHQGDIGNAVNALRDYRNAGQPLVEEVVANQLALLENGKTRDAALRFESALNAASASQNEADDIAEKMIKKGCFSFDTKVLMSDGSVRRIIDLRPGDRVGVFDVDKDMMASGTVTNTYRADADHYYLINGGLKITGGHPLFTAGKGWVKASDLEVGDSIAGADGPILIRSIKRTPHEHRVYNFRVVHSHNYFVSDDGKRFYLAHN